MALPAQSMHSATQRVSQEIVWARSCGKPVHFASLRYTPGRPGSSSGAAESQIRYRWMGVGEVGALQDRQIASNEEALEGSAIDVTTRSLTEVGYEPQGS